MAKHKQKMTKKVGMPKMATESAAEEMNEPQEDEVGSVSGLKRGGKAKAKKAHKIEGGKAKMRLDKPMRRATGGKVALDTTDDGVSPSNPMSKAAMKSGGVAKKKSK